MLVTINVLVLLNSVNNWGVCTSNNIALKGSLTPAFQKINGAFSGNAQKTILFCRGSSA